MDLREAVSLLGIVTFALLTWRVVSTWDQLTALERVLGVLLALSPLVASVAQWWLSRGPGAPHNPMLVLVILHRAACVLVVLAWVRLLRLRFVVVGR